MWAATATAFIFFLRRASMIPTPCAGGGRALPPILFDERMLQTHMGADLLQVKHTLRQVLVRASGLHATEGALAPAQDPCQPPTPTCGSDGRLRMCVYVCLCVVCLRARACM